LSAARVCWQGRGQVKSEYRNLNSGWETFKRESFDLLPRAQDKRPFKTLQGKWEHAAPLAFAILL
jgi:hypothetical protein